jgi:hypothetical protein
LKRFPLALTTAKCKEHKGVDEEELKNIDNHATKRDLERSQVRIDTEYVHQLHVTANR